MQPNKGKYGLRHVVGGYIGIALSVMGIIAALALSAPLTRRTLGIVCCTIILQQSLSAMRNGREALRNNGNENAG